MPLFAAEAARLAAARTSGRAATALERRAQTLAEVVGAPATLLLGVSRVTTALSAREEAVAELAAQGRSNADIAARLHLSVRTVENHVSRVLRKLRLSGRVELTAWNDDGPAVA